MRISPINSNYQTTMVKNKVQNQKNHQQTFQGKYDCTKFFATAMAGAAIGTVIMTGGVALPIVLGYGALCAASGAGLGLMIDKGSKDDKK